MSQLPLDMTRAAEMRRGRRILPEKSSSVFGVPNV
jgi:hypothetical protein